MKHDNIAFSYMPNALMVVLLWIGFGTIGIVFAYLAATNESVLDTKAKLTLITLPFAMIIFTYLIKFKRDKYKDKLSDTADSVSTIVVSLVSLILMALGITLTIKYDSFFSWLLCAIFFILPILATFARLNPHAKIVLAQDRLCVPNFLKFAAGEGIPYTAISEVSMTGTNGNRIIAVKHSKGDAKISEILVPSKKDFDEIFRILKARCS